ncbi:MAG: glycoside hydrolase family 10 protein [Candidatus Dormibacteraceae bacterium]
MNFHFRTLPSIALLLAISISNMSSAVANASAPEVAQARGCSSTVATSCQLRGVWIATVKNIDWPSKPGLPAAQQQAELTTLFDQAKAMKMNAVFVQVRPSADALYPTPYAPWSQYLTGTQGKSPGYDPLAFMVAAAHARNLELHAWFNPYRVSIQPDLAKLAPNNPARLHPEWVRSYGGQLLFDPGIPAARRYIEASVMDAVRRYDIDGVHFDDYFYPYPVHGQVFDDDATYHHYGMAQFSNKADWRRNNVNLLISELSRQIHSTKPWLKFGVSPFGVWRNKATDPTGSETTAGAQDYDDLYADTRSWIRHGWIDYIAPEIYWNIGFPAAAYDKLVPWWVHEVAGTRVNLYIGQAAYKIGHNNVAWNNPEEMPNHLALDAGYPAVKGEIYFSMTSLLANPLGFEERLEGR